LPIVEYSPNMCRSTIVVTVSGVGVRLRSDIQSQQHPLRKRFQPMVGIALEQRRDRTGGAGLPFQA